MKLLLVLLGVSAMIGLAAPGTSCPDLLLRLRPATTQASSLRYTKPASSIPTQLKPSRPAKRCARA